MNLFERLLISYGIGTVSASNEAVNAVDAFDHMIGTTKPYIVNASWSIYPDDPLCKGETDLSKSANDLYENSIPLIKTAGNFPPSTTPPVTDCTVGSPGSAIGVFTVSSYNETCSVPHYSTAVIGDSDKVRYADDFVRAWGGNSTEGKGRTIIDLSAYDCRGNMFDTSGTYTGYSCGTSYAAPTVAGAAVNFADFYKATFSSAVDDPGILYTNLLLMGDRSIGFGKTLSGFDNVTGSGRFKMRKWDSTGLDEPFEWATGMTCVEDGKVIKLLNNKHIPKDVDAFKAVIWWYDRRHESGGTIDDIDLLLKYTGGSVINSSISNDDNKERVFYDNVSFSAGPLENKNIDLELVGVDVSSSNEGCGSKGMMVYYAWMYEDSDRDDSNGPTGPGFSGGIEVE